MSKRDHDCGGELERTAQTYRSLLSTEQLGTCWLNEIGHGGRHEKSRACWEGN